MVLAYRFSIRGPFHSVVATEPMTLPLVSSLGTVAQPLARPVRPAALYASAKRVLDILVALVMLITLSPLFLAIAIAIRLDGPGPVFYRGERVGRYGKRFRVVKFRSMRANADSGAHAAFLRELMRETTPCAIYKVPCDARVTRVGRMLRRTSLDELPQLWNVLLGDMSLVGPRPDVAYAVADYAAWMQRRLVVPPGLTGLWQVSGRSRLSLMDMYRLDVEYAEQASLRLDLCILLRTIPVVLSRDGAE